MSTDSYLVACFAIMNEKARLSVRIRKVKIREKEKEKERKRKHTKSAQRMRDEISRALSRATI